MEEAGHRMEGRPLIPAKVIAVFPSFKLVSKKSLRAQNNKPRLMTTVCFVLEEMESVGKLAVASDDGGDGEVRRQREKEMISATAAAEKLAQKLARKKSERFTYLVDGAGEPNPAYIKWRRHDGLILHAIFVFFRIVTTFYRVVTTFYGVVTIFLM